MDATLSLQLTQALFITLVGMSLVFGAILLLWGVIAAMVRLFPETSALESEALEPGEAEFALPESAPPALPLLEAPGEPAASESPLNEALDPAIAAAAAAAVALAVALERAGRPSPIPSLPVYQPVSAWQTVMRTNILNKRGSVR